MIALKLCAPACAPELDMPELDMPELETSVFDAWLEAHAATANVNTSLIDRCMVPPGVETCLRARMDAGVNASLRWRPRVGATRSPRRRARARRAAPPRCALRAEAPPRARRPE